MSISSEPAPARASAAQAAPDRQLPAHDTYVFAPRQHEHVLVIPVINEGERILRQLDEIRLARPPVDIIIADGGSTDGSLDHETLKHKGVRALLVKTGTGRLSAQLRMAYAWALDEGYTGILTMDGNGKDGVEGIERISTRLKEGYDIVQGSRYRRGGAAVNTPFDRHLAGRLIHAPLCSMAAGVWYTDTTNGFRGYSARYLNDPRVAPFRDIFDRYALLFYLSTRGPRLGYRATEVGVRRFYPHNAPTPTKISGMQGRLDMLKELWDVVRGRYAPSPPD